MFYARDRPATGNPSLSRLQYEERSVVPCGPSHASRCTAVELRGDQGITPVHFSAQLEAVSDKKIHPRQPPITPQYPLNDPYTNPACTLYPTGSAQVETKS